MVPDSERTVRIVAKDACSRRPVSLVDRPCKLHFRQDTVFPLPCLCRNQATRPVTEFRSQNLEKPCLPLPIILLFKPLVEILQLTLLSLLVVVSKIHSFEEGNCGGQLLPLAEKAKVRRVPPQPRPRELPGALAEQPQLRPPRSFSQQSLASSIRHFATQPQSSQGYCPLSLLRSQPDYSFSGVKNNHNTSWGRA